MFGKLGQGEDFSDTLVAFLLERLEKCQDAHAMQGVAERYFISKCIRKCRLPEVQSTDFISK